MSYTPQLNPQPLGNVTVATPGTPVQITTTLQATAVGSGNIVNSSTDIVACNKISLIASTITHAGAGNTGLVYFGAQGMVRATLAGVLGLVYPGGSYSLVTNVNLNEYDANKLYIDADTAGDGVFGFLDTV